MTPGNVVTMYPYTGRYGNTCTIYRTRRGWYCHHHTLSQHYGPFPTSFAAREAADQGR